MGLFDLFSNDTAERARDMANAGLQKGYDALSSSYGQGRDALTSGYGQASNLYAGLGDYFNNAYGGGTKAYGDASGANGVDGLQRATDTFKNSGQYGAYGFSLDQGLQALNRTHAAAGNLASGNADIDAMKYASGLAGQQYNNYLQGLQPYLGLDASGRTAAITGQAGAAAGLGNALNASYTGQGTAANAMYTGQGNNDAGAEMNNYKVGGNILGAITGLGGLALGGAGGLTSGLSSLFSGFGNTLGGMGIAYGKPGTAGSNMQGPVYG